VWGLHMVYLIRIYTRIPFVLYSRPFAVSSVVPEKSRGNKKCDEEEEEEEKAERQNFCLFGITLKWP